MELIRQTDGQQDNPDLQYQEHPDTLYKKCSRIAMKPHYRSEGHQQGSCGVFGGSEILFMHFLRVYSPNYVFRN